MNITVKIKSGFSKSADEIKKKIDRIMQDSEPILLGAAAIVLPEVHDRIHGKGLRSDNSQIGTYTKEYLKYRQNKYNRTAETDIIFSLTGQMENDFTVVSEGDIVGLGFQNQANFEKATWLEERFSKTGAPVYYLSEDEQQTVVRAIENYINDIFERNG